MKDTNNGIFKEQINTSITQISANTLVILSDVIPFKVEGSDAVIYHYVATRESPTQTANASQLQFINDVLLTHLLSPKDGILAGNVCVFILFHFFYPFSLYGAYS